MKSLAEEGKVVGIKIYLGYEHIFANDERCEPIYELCEDLGIPVIFHTGDTYNYPKAIVRYANPEYIEDVAVAHRKLKIIIAHLGNPHWMDIVAMILTNKKNVYADISGTLSYKGNRFNKEDDENFKERLMKLIVWCGDAKKLIFGTDYPIYQQKRYIEFVESIDIISKSEKRYLYYKNAEKLFDIS
jgi:hypothetical protein